MRGLFPRRVRIAAGCTKSALLIGFVFMISPMHAERAGSASVRTSEPIVTGSVHKKPSSGRPDAAPSQRRGWE
jgi:hypothetical protein